jgi:hypothetical protein
MQQNNENTHIFFLLGVSAASSQNSMDAILGQVRCFSVLLAPRKRTAGRAPL